MELHMTKKLIVTAVGAMTLSQIVSAQGLLTGNFSDKLIGYAPVGDVQVVNVSADILPAQSSVDFTPALDYTADDVTFVSQADDSTTATPQDLVPLDSSVDTAAVSVVTELPRSSELSAIGNGSKIQSANSDLLDVAFSSPDLTTGVNSDFAMSASGGSVEKAPEVGAQLGDSGRVADIAHPNVAVPEPGTLGLLMVGAGAFVRFFRRK